LLVQFGVIFVIIDMMIAVTEFEGSWGSFRLIFFQYPSPLVSGRSYTAKPRRKLVGIDIPRNLLCSAAQLSDGPGMAVLSPIKEMMGKGPFPNWDMVARAHSSRLSLDYYYIIIHINYVGGFTLNG
jgi:hypothetical protein